MYAYMAFVMQGCCWPAYFRAWPRMARIEEYIFFGGGGGGDDELLLNSYNFEKEWDFGKGRSEN